MRQRTKRDPSLTGGSWAPAILLLTTPVVRYQRPDESGQGAAVPAPPRPPLNHTQFPPRSSSFLRRMTAWLDRDLLLP